jgi:hypothetical protein
MNMARPAIVLSALLGLAGCAPVQPLVVADAVGPLQPLIAESGPHGSMIVYSDTQGPVADPADYSPHSDYKLYSADGQLLQTVQNRSATDARQAKTLRLAAGRYTVTAVAPRVGLVSIPVVVNEDQVTVIDLNREVLPNLLVAGEEWVRLPNGQIIGSRAQ